MVLAMATCDVNGPRFLLHCVVSEENQAFEKPLPKMWEEMMLLVCFLFLASRCLTFTHMYVRTYIHTYIHTGR